MANFTVVLEVKQPNTLTEYRNKIYEVEAEDSVMALRAAMVKAEGEGLESRFPLRVKEDFK